MDYYITMKLNDRSKSLMSLYRLFMISFMLRNARIEGMGLPHDYPKMMLCQLLVMTYWYDQQLPVWKLMNQNMCLFNEEMGEAYYSILGRVVLGDYIKSNFEHMNKHFKLLPIYKQVKDDIFADSNNEKFSLTWHHNIAQNSDEVTATAFFFKRAISDILRGKYRSYTFDKVYPAAHSSLLTRTTTYVPLIFNNQVVVGIDAIVLKIRKAITGNILLPHLQDWPFEPPDSDDDEGDASEESDDDGSEDVNSSMTTAGETKEDHSVIRWYKGPPWEQCVVGQFAVVRSLIGTPPQKGIRVIKITKKFDIRLVPGNDSIMQLEGKEYIGTISNIDPRCQRHAKWHWHQRRSVTDTFDNYEVVVYFQALNDGHLPTSIIHKMDVANNTSPLFEQHLSSP